MQLGTRRPQPRVSLRLCPLLLPPLVQVDALRLTGDAVRDELAAAGFTSLTAEIPDAEEGKHIQVAAFCWQVLGRAGFTRSDATGNSEIARPALRYAQPRSRRTTARSGRSVRLSSPRGRLAASSRPARPSGS